MKKLLTSLTWGLLLALTGVVSAQTSPFVPFADYLGEDRFSGSTINQTGQRLDSLVAAYSPQLTWKAGYVDLLPLAVYYDPAEGTQLAYDAMLASIKSDYEAFFAVVSYPTGETTRDHRLEFVVPTHGLAGELNALQRLSIYHAVQAEFEARLATSPESAAESAADHLAGLLNGGIPISTDYEDLGFTELRFEGVTFDEVEVRSDRLEEHYESAHVLDYSQLYVQGRRIGEPFLQVVADLPFPDVYVYVTSAHNAVTATSFSAAADAFGAEEEKLSLWLHVEYRSPTEYRLYAKSHSNQTQAEAEAYLSDFFDERLGTGQEDEVLAIKDPEVREREAKSLNGQECEGKLSLDDLSLYDYLRGNVEHGRDFSFYCLYENGSPAEEPWQTIGTALQFQFGVVAGMLDGLAGTVSALRMLSRGFFEVMRNNPFSMVFQIELLNLAIQQQSLMKAWSIKVEQLKDFWTTAWEFATALISGWESILNQILAEIKNWFRHLNPMTGLFSTGHAIGLVVFEVLIELLTSGTSSLATLGAKVAKLGTSALTLLGKPSTWSRHIAVVKTGLAKAKGLSSRALLSLSHLGQCFVAGTLVALAPAPLQGTEVYVPIEEVALFDLVLVNTTVSSSLPNDLPALPDPYTSVDQLALDLQSEPSRLDWHVAELQASYGETQLHLARPAAWFAGRGFRDVGDVAEVSIPEFGLSGLFTLKHLREATEAEVAKISGASGDRMPVLATVTHQAPEVLTLIAGRDTLEVTPKHRIYSADRSDFVPAGDLRLGERLKTRDGTVEVLSIDTALAQATPVFNLEVYRHHNYHVGKQQVLVHNLYSLAWIKKVRSLAADAAGDLDEFARFIRQMPAKRLEQFITELRISGAATAANSDLIKLVKAWEGLFPDAILRRDPSKLGKVTAYQSDFSRSFDDITAEFNSLPPGERGFWIDHLEFRTSGNRVNKAADRPDAFNAFASNDAVPNRYTSDNRFNDLASDPDHGGQIKVSSRREATAGLEAETQGLVPGPISRDPSGAEFIDGNGGYTG